LVTPRSIGTPTSATSRPAEVGQRQHVGPERHVEQRGRIRERPFAALGAGEHLRRDRCELGIENIAPLGVRIFQAQGFEFPVIHRARPLGATAPNGCRCS
jgi:hypothetical protein